MGKTTSLMAGLGLSGKAFNRKVRKERPPRTQRQSGRIPSDTGNQI